MRYITLEEFKLAVDQTQLAQLTDDATGIETVDSIAQTYVEEAESLCESIAGARYVVPFTLESGYTSYDAILKRLVKGMAFALLSERRGWTLTEEQKGINEWASKYINAIRTGDADIPHCILSSKVTSSYSGTARSLGLGSLTFFG